MKKQNPLLVVYLVAALGFAGAAVGIYFGMIIPANAKADIARYGTEAIATVNSVSSSTDDDGDTSCAILYSFTDSNGITRSGKTGYVYSEKTAESIKQEGTLLIKYDEATGDSVPANYVRPVNFMWLFIVVFGAVAVLTLFKSGQIAVKTMKAKAVLRDGTDGKGEFQKFTTALIVNGVPSYHILFTFENREGKILNCKPAARYSLNEVEFLRQLKQFDIKYSGDSAVITQDLSGADSVQFEGKEPADYDNYGQNNQAPPQNSGANAQYGAGSGDIWAPYDSIYKQLLNQNTAQDMYALLESYRPSLNPYVYQSLLLKAEEIIAQRCWPHGSNETR